MLHFNKVIRVNITSSNLYGHHVVYFKMERAIASVVFFTYMDKLSLITRNHQTNPKWETFYKTPDITSKCYMGFWADPRIEKGH